MRGKRGSQIVLQKMIGYCDEISKMVARRNKDRTSYENDMEFQYASGMCILQLGELITRLDDAFMDEHTEVPWRKIKNMRNIYAHDYEVVDHDIVWQSITEDIPALKVQLEQILMQLQECGE